ncbi:MAG TPA: hypothetical protein VFX49_06790 [Chloroflexota bacterium]|nr:hypothetical protein [Chloroflexota bacterium]
MTAVADAATQAGVGARDGRTELTVRRDAATGREIRQITRSDEASFHSYYDLCPWNARGDKIVFCAVAKDRPGSDVYWMEAETGRLHFVAHSSRTNPHTGVHQQWIGDGDVVAYEDSDERGPCVRLINLSDGRTGRLPGLARMVSPDGRWVASHTNSRDEAAIMRRGEAGVFVAPLPEVGGKEGEAPRLIASTEAALALNPRRGEVGHCHIYTKHAKFSPDGTRLMFVFTNEIEYDVRYGEPRVKDLYVVNADGSDLRFVSHFTWGNHPSWHPNGRQILFNGRLGDGGSTEKSDPMRFVLADVASGALSVATDLAPGGGHPPFSPDGRKIAAEYVSRESGEARVVCVHLDERRVDELARFRVTDHSHQGTHIHPTWSRDGREVLFNADESGHAELWVAAV